MSDIEQHPAEVSIEIHPIDDAPSKPERFSSMLIPHQVWEEDGRRIIGFARIGQASAIRVTTANGEIYRFVRDAGFVPVREFDICDLEEETALVRQTELVRLAELARTDLEAFYREVEEWRREGGYA